MSKIVQAYGTWHSPISAKMIAGSTKFGAVRWDDDGNTLVWSEQRDGRGTLIAQTGDDAPRELNDASLTVRGRVGYGGGEFTVANGHVYFAANQGRLYKVPVSGGQPKPITPAFGAAASPSVSPDGRWVAFVHTYEGIDGIGIVDCEGNRWPVKLASGDDFVMQPVWHPAGKHLTYIAWNHPQMPWLGTELRLVTLDHDDDHAIPHADSIMTVAGDTSTSIFQPAFSPDGRYLSYVSDETGYWQLYLYDIEAETHKQITHADAEHGLPAWIQGLQTYGWTGDSAAIFYVRQENGAFSVWAYDLEHDVSLCQHELDSYTYMDQLSVSPTSETLAMIASSSQIPERVITYSAEKGVRVVRRSAPESISMNDLAQAQAITWTGHDGETVHGLYYAPTNSRYEGIGKPPLIVNVHGGPTSNRQARYYSEVQFFTSRGFAVLQPNHRGSTGYGRAYMLKHEHSWGIYDVEDSASGAQYLVEQGLADPDKLIIMGGSAGGYTVLQSLVDKPGFYKAGINSYGIADQFALVRDTHKFESRYSDWLLGELPQSAERYRDRSPIYHVDQLRDALAVFQGSEDTVVPQNQSDMIVAALQRRGIPHVYHVYEGEGHGFRQSENIEHFINTVLDFLTQYVLYA